MVTLTRGFFISPSFSSRNRKAPSESFRFLGGDDGIRTHDPLLAGQVLSQLSYTPIIEVWGNSEEWRGFSSVFSYLFSLLSTFFLTFGEWLLPLPSVSVSIELSSRAVARKVLSPLQSLTSVFGMGTGGPSAFVTLTLLFSRFILIDPWILNNTISQLRFSSISLTHKYSRTHALSP